MSEATSDVFVGGLGLLRNTDGDETRYLARREAEQGVYRLPMGEQLGDESLREVVQRELAWQFRLDRRRDFIVSSVPRLNFKALFVGCEGDLRPYVVEFYIADLFGRSGRETIAADPENRWLTRRDLLGETDVELDPEQRRLLQQADVLSPDGR